MKDSPETHEELLRYLQRESRIQRRRGTNTRSPIGLAADVLQPRGMINASTGEPVLTFGTNPYESGRTEPPGRPSTPVATSRLGVVTVCWDGLTDEGILMPSNLQRVEVHRSLEIDFIPTPATWVQNLTGPSCASITDQVYGTTYYYRLVAVNRYGSSEPSGAASAVTQALVNTDIIGQVIDGANIVDGSITASDKIIGNTITGALIQALAIQAGHLDANSVTAMNIEAGAVTAEKLSALLVLATKMTSAMTGRRWEADQFGIRLYAADGSIIVNLPTDAAAPATFSGDILAGSITISDQFALRGTTNEIAKGGMLTLAGGTTAPSSPPTVDVAWESVAVYNPHDGEMKSDDSVRHGWVRNGSHYYSAHSMQVGNGKIRRYDATTGDVDASWVITSPSLKYLTGGVAFIGSDLYVMGKVTWTGSWIVEKYNITTLARTGTWTWGGAVNRWPALGTKGTNLIIAFYRDGLDRLEIEEVNPATGAQVTLFTSTLGYYDNITSVNYGTFDFGANRFVVTYENRAFDITWQPQPAVLSVSGTTLNYVAEQVWLVPNRTYGMCWDSVMSKFIRLQDDAVMIRHTGITWTAFESSKWWIAHTWYDSNAGGTGNHETNRSPSTSFTMQKRALVEVTLPPLPVGTGSADDATAARVYLARGDTVPLTTKFERQATLPDGSTYLRLTTATLPAGTADATLQPPPVNNFPDASPATLRSANDRFTVDGGGVGSWGSLSVTSGSTYISRIARIATPMLMASSSTTQAITANTSTLITWPTPSVNDDTWTINADNATWVCPRDGTYTIFLQVQVGTNVTGTNWIWTMIYADTTDGQARAHGFLPPNTNSAEFECVLPNARILSGQTVWTYARSNIANSLTLKTIKIVRYGGGNA